jgi:hypothetical protein
MWTVVWTIGSLIAFGLVSAIIPNPIFGREIAPEPFAYAVWIASAPLMGIVAATYTAPPVAAAAVTTLAPRDPEAREEQRDGTLLGTFASFGAFLAIGCPVCNKVALLLLGTGGAMTVYAPIQPFIGAASLVLLAGTVIWRLRLRARGNACAT